MEIKKSYTLSEEVTNSTSHAIGVVMGAVVCAIFLNWGYERGSALAIFSLWLYMFGVVSSYIASTLYHACPPQQAERKARLRKFDHAAIYWHIAGSYSPITLIALHGAGAEVWAWVIFGFVWACAIVGTILSLRKLKSHSYLETACYVLMGLTILVAFKPFVESVDLNIVLWVVAEGVCYITGAVLYGFKKVKFMHSVFHLFVLAGDVCHMVALSRVFRIFMPSLA